MHHSAPRALPTCIACSYTLNYQVYSEFLPPLSARSGPAGDRRPRTCPRASPAGRRCSSRSHSSAIGTSLQRNGARPLIPLSLPRFGAPRACTVRPGSHRAFPPDVSDKGVVGTSHCHELEGRGRHRAVPGNARGRADRSLVGAEDALLDHVRRYSHIFLKLMTLWPDRERLGPTPRCAATAPCIPPGGPRRWSAPIAFVVTLKRDGGNVCGRERNLTYLGAGGTGT